MNWLLIEDDPNKAEQIMEFLGKNYADKKVIIKKSYQSGLHSIFNDDIELIMLDMSLPTFDITTKEDGYLHKQLAGKEILREMKRKKRFIKTIIVTQFDTFGESNSSVSLESVKNDLKQLFPDIYDGAVYYKAGQTQWQTDLKNLLNSQAL